MTGSLMVTDTVTHLSTTVPLTGNGVNPPGAMSGLAYYLPFTDGTGTTVHDASGNGRDGTLAGPGLQPSGTPQVLPSMGNEYRYQAPLASRPSGYAHTSLQLGATPLPLTCTWLLWRMQV
jgi:hypothetical protein